MSLEGHEPVLDGPTRVWVAGQPSEGPEALARAWERGGPTAVAGWPGDWALVARRPADDRLWVQTDPFAGVPLFVRGDRAFLDPAVLRPGPLDQVELRQHLAARFVEPWRTWWTDLWRIPAGHAGALGHARDLRRVYLPSPGTTPVRVAVQRAVDDRLCLEEPVDLALSGGLDSSSLAVCLRDRPVRCRTLTFPGWAADESRYADAVVRRLGLQAVPLDARSLDPFVVLEQLGPFPPVLSNHHLLAALLDPGRTLVTGFGGDEVLDPGLDVVAEQMARGRPLRGLIEALALAARHRHLRRPRRRELHRWLGEAVRTGLKPPRLQDLRAARLARILDPLVVRSREEQLRLARLRQARLVMPFLDPRVVSAGLAHQRRTRLGRTRLPLRTAFAHDLPPEVGRRTTKADLSRSVSEHFQTGLQTRLTHVRDSGILHFVPEERVDDLLRSASGGDHTSEVLLWRLLGTCQVLMAQ